jgi:uncharacterized protein (TIGR04255 family)
VTGEIAISPTFKSDDPVSGELRPVDYEKPPVVETSFGFGFLPIKGWNLFHLGMFWSRLRGRYEHAEARLPTGSVHLDDLDLRLGPEVRLESLPLRSWFLDSSKNQLLQVQANAFIRNWRAVESENKYCHYSDLRPMFQRDWEEYTGFLQSEKLSRPSVFRCDVTYVNHFVKGREWENLEQLESLFPRMKFGIPGALTTSFSWMAVVGQNQVRVEASPGLRADGAPIIQLTLNVSGKPGDTSEHDIWAKLDDCHKLLVETFAEITAGEVQRRVWRRIR